MKRETLIEILRSHEELSEKSGVFKTSDAIDLTVYLGRPGGSLTVPRVVLVEARASFVRVVTSKEETYYAEPSQVRAILCAPRSPASRKAGFG